MKSLSGDPDGVRSLTVPIGNRTRIDALVARELGLSRTRVQSLISAGRVTSGGRVPRKSEMLPEGALVTVSLPAPEPAGIRAERIPLDIVYDDPFLCVVNKPAGMVTHPAPGHRSGTLVNALMHHVSELSDVGGRLRPGIVHRLDRHTSGLLVVAKRDSTHRSLQADLARKRVRRIYAAAAWGRLPSARLDIDAPIGRHPKHRRRMAVVARGRKAFTSVGVAERWRCAEYLEIELGTGRTHQIRVHLAYSGHPVVGDEVYGSERWKGFGGENRRWAKELASRTPRQFLHARRLEFRHPATGEPMSFAAELPPELAEVREWALQD